MDDMTVLDQLIFGEHDDYFVLGARDSEVWTLIKW